MGYRSNLFIKCTWEGAKELIPVLQETELLNYGEIAEDEDYFYITLYDLKWYNSYSDVSKVNAVIDALGDDCGMIREGEEPDDIEYYGDCDAVNLYSNTVVEIGGFYGRISSNKSKTLYPEFFI